MATCVLDLLHVLLEQELGLTHEKVHLELKSTKVYC